MVEIKPLGRVVSVTMACLFTGVSIAQFRYIKIQPETIASLRGSGKKPHMNATIHSPEPRSDVWAIVFIPFSGGTFNGDSQW